jgi:hypothetical protein
MKPSYAGLWVRITAFAFNYILIAGYLILVVALSSMVNALFPAIARRVFADPLSGQITGFCLVTLPVSLYFALLESSAWQATWGKRRKSLRRTYSVTPSNPACCASQPAARRSLRPVTTCRRLMPAAGQLRGQAFAANVTPRMPKQPSFEAGKA